MKRNLVLLLVIGLFLAALLSREASFLWLSLPFLFYLAAGLLTAPGPVRLRAARAVSRARCESGSPVTMILTIENTGPGIALLRVQDRPWPGMRLVSGSLNRAAAMPPGGMVDLEYTFEAPRGSYRWESIHVTASDPFGLFETFLDLPAPGQLLVFPRRIPLNRLRLRHRSTLRAPGPNLSRLPGTGTDFYGVRQYAAGDSMRSVHWRLSARHPGQFFSKQFEREEMADIGILLDGGAAANLTTGTENLFEYSIEAAAALARGLLRAGNRLSLLVLGDRVLRVFPGTGKYQLARILEQLAACAPGEKAALDTLKYLPVRLFPGRSLVIIISPLRTADYPAVARLRAGGHPVLLVSPDPVDFAARGQGSHPAVRAARVERTALLWRIRDLGVQVIDWQVDRPFYQAAGRFKWMEG